MKRLRLILTYKCERSCDGCCNKHLPVKPIKVDIDDINNYDEIYFTGGESMLFKEKLFLMIINVRVKNVKKYLYTAEASDSLTLSVLVKWLDGLTFTIHEEKDLNTFIFFDQILFLSENGVGKSLRLNVFNNIEIPKLYNNWDIRYKEWQPYCPLPEDETLAELKDLWR